MTNNIGGLQNIIDNGHSRHFQNAANNSHLNYNGKCCWEFPRHRLKFFNILGEGAFGQVWRCEANDIDGKYTHQIIWILQAVSFISQL